MNDPTHWWTHEGLEAPKGRLHIAGRDADALAREHGTPLYVFDLNRVEANFRRIEGAFERAGVRHQLLYALKSNRNPKVLGRVRSLGFAGADVCSPNEVDIALENGWRPDEISYTGTSLSDRDLDRILRHPVTLNLDSLSAIRRVGARGPGRRIGLRINPGVGAGFSSKLTYSGEKPTKFGIYPDQFGEALDLAQQHRLEVRGLHFHIGSGWLRDGIGRVFEAADRAVTLARRVERLDYVNVGGGLGVKLLGSDHEVDLDAYAEGLARVLGSLDVTVVCEPGDFIVRDAGVLLVQVTGVDVKGGVTFVGVDCGSNAYPLPLMYDYPQEVMLCRAVDDPPRISCTIAGHINEACDLFAEDYRLPEVREGDILAILNTGGYAAWQASEHCARPHAGHLALP